MEGLRPFTVLHMFLYSAKSTHFVSNLEKLLQYNIGVVQQMIMVHHDSGWSTQGILSLQT